MIVSLKREYIADCLQEGKKLRLQKTKSQLLVSKDDGGRVVQRKAPDHEDSSEVSDLESGASDEDELLESIINDNEVVTAVDLGTDTSQGEIVTHSSNSILDTEYGDEVPPPTLPPVSKQLAKTVTKWLRVSPKRETIKTYFKQALLPDNVDGLKLVKINDILYQTLPFKAKVNDQ